MSSLPYYTALTMGFIGSLHCAGMCGPIMLILPFQWLQGWRKWVGVTLYHLGRISVYALLGLLLFSFKGLFNPAWQQYVSIGLGIAFLLFGLLSFIARGKQLAPGAWTSFVRDRLSQYIGKTSILAMLMTGALNGMMPCGLVYMALSLTTSVATHWEAMGVMYAFGLGTVPMLVTLLVLKRRITARFNTASLYRYMPVIMLFFGGLFLLRGMNLGIPYLSPGVSIEQNEVKSSCCHKH